MVALLGDSVGQFTSLLPSLATSEPVRIATITQYYQAVARTLVYLLRCVPAIGLVMYCVVSFRCAGPLKVPLHLLMTVICQPFSLVPDKLVSKASAAAAAAAAISGSTN